MRIALFFDGNNYYRALREFDQALEIDQERFTAWVTERIGGAGARFVGAYYYTGTFDEPTGSSEALDAFLDGLETVTGFFVRREPRVRRSSTCRSCGAQNEYLTEKRVDTRLVAELIQLAAVGGFDAALVLSGDGDFVPAVQAVGALGKQVWIGAWPGQRVARELRANSFGVLDLGDGAEQFSTGRRRPGAAQGNSHGEAREPVPGARRDLPAASDEELRAAILDELRSAQAQLPYVSRWYFVNRWRGERLPPGPAERDRLLQQLVAERFVEEHEVADANGRPTAAIRAMGEIAGPA